MGFGMWDKNYARSKPKLFLCVQGGGAVAKLDEVVARDLKESIRGLSRQAAIQVLLGVVETLLRNVSLRASDFPEYVNEAKELMKSEKGLGGS